MLKKFFKVLLMFIIITSVFVCSYTLTVISKTPKINPGNIYSRISESSILYDDKNRILERLHLENGNRTIVKYEKLPKNLINAIIAIEDRRFWHHNGFNFIRMGGALRDAVLKGGRVSGTSTLTQQLARDVYLADIKTVRSAARKISEAYYALNIERELSKKEIITAYLNSIYLGFNSYGVQAAAKTYFGKDVNELDLIECAAIAAIPKASGRYALVSKLPRSDSSNKATSNEKRKVLAKSSDFIYLYNGDASKARRHTVLNIMYKMGKITKSQLIAAKKVDLSKRIKISNIKASSNSYYTDYLTEQLVADLKDKFDISDAEARKKLYTSGYKIYTSFNQQAQDAIERNFAKDKLFPSVTSIRFDNKKNILGSSGNIMLYKYGNLFDKSGNFILKPKDYYMSKGNMIIRKGRKLSFYKTRTSSGIDYSLEFKKIYKRKNSTLYTIDGGVILIPQQYKRLTSSGDMLISADFFAKTPRFYKKKSGGKLAIASSYLALRAEARQPQAAMVITDYKTGAVKAIMGGRGIFGKRLFNRAVYPRQPGSSIKPLSVYAPALQLGKDEADEKSPLKYKNLDKNQKSGLYGKYWTAASLINDAPLYFQCRRWPKNWYRGYRGLMTLRKSVEQSVNVNAVRVYQQLDTAYIVYMLRKSGIDSIDASSPARDRNPAALALGGMTKGISPLAMSSAYGIFPNRGVLKPPVLYTKVVDRNGKVILQTGKKKEKVYSDSVAFIMQDILRTTVSKGLGKFAKVPGKPTAGKTGTTNDKKDIWFCGFTPQYSAAVWIGNDVGISLSDSSTSAAKLWSRIMRQATSGMSGKLPSPPASVVRKNGEFFAKGTESGIRLRHKNKKAKKRPKVTKPSGSSNTDVNRIKERDEQEEADD